MSIRDALDNRLLCQHEVGMNLMLNIPTAKLMKQPAPDKWSMHEQFAHLVLYQKVFIERVRMILRLKEPVFSAYSADTDPHFTSFVELDGELLVHNLVNDRFLIYNQFQAFSNAELKRKGKHPVYGSMTLLDWHEFFVLHEAHHLFAMFRLSKV